MNYFQTCGRRPKVRMFLELSRIDSGTIYCWRSEAIVKLEYTYETWALSEI